MKLRKHIEALCILAALMAALAGFPAMASDIRYSGLRASLDSVPLNPQGSGIEEIDAYMDAFLAQITTPEMDTHDKLRACYDYLIRNTVYGVPDVYSENCRAYGSFYGAGYTALSTGVGDCYLYSAAFAMLAQRIGVPVRVVEGQTHTSGGGFTAHKWCQLDMGNGVVYIFDPQVEDSIADRQGGEISYLRFGGTTQQLADKYILDTSLSGWVDGFEGSNTATVDMLKEIGRRAQNYYKATTGKKALYSAQYRDGIVTVTLTNSSGATVDQYVIDGKTGIGTNMQGETVDLTSGE